MLRWLPLALGALPWIPACGSCDEGAPPVPITADDEREEGDERAERSSDEPESPEAGESTVPLTAGDDPPPAAAAPSPATVAARLAPWALPRPTGPRDRQRVFLTVDGEAVVLVGGSEFWRVELDREEAPVGVAPWMPGPRDASEMEWMPPEPFGGLFLSGTDRELNGPLPPLRALDAQTLQERWQVPELGFDVHGVGATEGTVVAVTHRRVDAMDLATGRRLWGDALETRYEEGEVWLWTLAVDRGVAVVSRGPRIVARDARTGDVRWEGEPSPHWQSLVPGGEGRVGVVEGKTIRVLDISNGRELGRARFTHPAHPWSAPMIDGDWIYALGTDDETVIVQARRWRGGSGRFDTRLPFGAAPPLPEEDDWDELAPSVAAMDGVLFVCRGGDVMHAISATTGERFWTERATPCHQPRVWHPHPGAAGVLFPDPWRSADAWALGAEPVATHSQTVNGTVDCDGPLAGADVWIGEKHTRTDRQGRFRATFADLRSDAVAIHVEPPREAPRTCRAASSEWSGEPIEIDVYDPLGGEHAMPLIGL